MGLQWVECNPQGLQWTVAPPKKAYYKKQAKEANISLISLLFFQVFKKIMLKFPTVF